MAMMLAPEQGGKGYQQYIAPAAHQKQGCGRIQRAGQKIGR
jgi:hypothetical protein